MRMRLPRRSHRLHAGPGKYLKLEICPSAAPSLAGALCVPFDACVVAMDRAEEYFKITLRPVWANHFWICTSRVPRQKSLRTSARRSSSVEQARGDSDMGLSDGGASLPRIAKMLRTDINALTLALPTGRNLQASTTRAYSRYFHYRSARSLISTHVLESSSQISASTPSGTISSSGH